MNIKNELEKSIPKEIRLTEKEKASIRLCLNHPAPNKHEWRPALITVLLLMIVCILVLPSIREIKINEHTLSNQLVDNTTEPTANLSNEQKQQYYQQYVNIVESAMQLKSGIGISVAPIEEFKDSDWVTPEIFEKNIFSMVDRHLVRERELLSEMQTSIEPAKTNSNGDTIKTTYISFPDDFLVEIEVKANFVTDYNRNLDRQIFVGLNNVLTELKATKGEWKQTSYKATIVDNGQKYIINIEGVYNYNGLSSEKAFTIEFMCDESGGIS